MSIRPHSLAFLLLIVGTGGLLAAELTGGWARPVTLALAALNVIGLTTLFLVRGRA